VREPLLQTFPFPSTLGEVTLHPLSQTCMFVYSSLGKWVFPPLLWNFPPLPLSQAFPLLVAGCTPPLPLEPLWPGPACLFTVLGRIPFPPSSKLSVPHPLCNMSLLFLLLIIQFLLFPCPGGYAVLAQGCLLEYHVLLSSPCLHLPKPSGHGQLAAWGPSWFLRLM
jgi:hypothetical protein